MLQQIEHENFIIDFTNELENPPNIESKRSIWLGVQKNSISLNQNIHSWNFRKRWIFGFRNTIEKMLLTAKEWPILFIAENTLGERQYAYATKTKRRPEKIDNVSL